MKVAICGGGTGGHLHPLLALAGELALHDGVGVTLFLSRKTPSGDLPAGNRVISFDVRGFNRRLDPENLEAVRDLWRAFRECDREMRTWTPDVAVAFGGYACVPGACAALKKRVPLLIHEQNVVPGLANRVLAPFSEVLAVSFEETLERNPGWIKKAVVTGNPLLKPPPCAGTEDPWAYFGLQKGRKTIAVIGGSQGAASLNRAVLELLDLWRDRKDIQLVHSIGRDKYEEFLSGAAELESTSLVYRPFEFIERMDLLYAVSELAVCRAGASTVAELAVAACPSVLIPYPHATSAHQDANAGVLERAGAAVVLRDRELSGRRLGAVVGELLEEEGRLEEMRRSCRKIGRPGAAARLADLVLSYDWR